MVVSSGAAFVPAVFSEAAPIQVEQEFDAAAARRWFGPLGQVTLIGAPALNDLYAQALAAQDARSTSVDGDAAVLATAYTTGGGRSEMNPVITNTIAARPPPSR